MRTFQWMLAVHRKDTMALILKVSGSDPSLLSVLALAYCGLPRTFYLSASWSGPVFSMVIHLKRHHQRMHYIHNHNQKLRVYAETRAAHTTVMLVVTFVTFYLLDCICTFFHISFVNTHLWGRYVKEVLTVSLPTVSPLLLIFRDPKGPCWRPFMVGLQSHVTGVRSLEQESEVKMCPTHENLSLRLEGVGLFPPLQSWTLVCSLYNFHVCHIVMDPGGQVLP